MRLVCMTSYGKEAEYMVVISIKQVIMTALSETEEWVCLSAGNVFCLGYWHLGCMEAGQNILMCFELFAL